MFIKGITHIDYKLKRDIEKMESKKASQIRVLINKLKAQIDTFHPRLEGKFDLVQTIIVYEITFIITLFIIFILDSFVPFFNLNVISNPNSARYLLSSLIQSQAAILAIVITITLIAVQLAASSYSPRVIEIFKKYADFKILLFLYGISIFFMSGILKIIPEDINTFQSQISIHRSINIALVISVFTFTVLFPYILRTLNLLKPFTIIEVLAKDITKENILQSENNPLVIIFEFIRGSCLKYDFETTRKGLKEIGDKGIDLINSNFSETETDSIILIFANELEDFGKLAVNNRDDNSAKESVNILRTFNKVLIEKNLQKSIFRINSSLKSIGLDASEKKLQETTQETIRSLYEIGKLSIKKYPEVSEQSVLFLGNLARRGIIKKIEVSSLQAIRSIVSIGMIAVEEKLERTARMALWSLKLTGTTQDIYEQKLRVEKWQEFTIPEWDGETYEETVYSEGIVEETSLFEEIVRGVYYMGTSSIKKQYAISTDAISTLRAIGEIAVKHSFDDGGVPIFLGHIGIYAIGQDNKELALSSVKSLEAISIAIDTNLEDTIYQTSWSLIRVGTVAQLKSLNEIAYLAAQTLVDLIGNYRSRTTDVNNLFNSSISGIQEFKKIYHEIKNKTNKTIVSTIST